MPGTRLNASPCPWRGSMRATSTLRGSTLCPTALRSPTLRLSTLRLVAWRAGALLLACTLTGCALTPPRAWERDLLARPAMSLDADPLEQRFLSHIYTSKENSSGGDGVGGGGCGCN